LNYLQKIVNLLVLFYLISQLVACKSSKQIEPIKLENHNIEELTTHLKNIHSWRELYDKYKSKYYGNSKYNVKEYFLSKSEFEKNTQYKQLANIKDGEIIGPFPNQENGCSLYKKEKTEKINSAIFRTIFLYPPDRYIDPIRTEYTPPPSRDSILKLLEEGVDFKKLVALYSQDHAVKKDEGSYGWVPENMYLPEIESKSKEVELFEVFFVEVNVGTFICRLEEEWKERELAKIIELKIKKCN
jgi:hypothetical protein